MNAPAPLRLMHWVVTPYLWRALCAGVWYETNSRYDVVIYNDYDVVVVFGWPRR